MRGKVLIIMAALFLPLFPAPALALGPVTGEISLVWWHNGFDADGAPGLAESNADAAGLRGQIWLFNRVGIAAARLESDIGDISTASNTADYTHLDLTVRLFGSLHSSHLAVGVGWQDAGLEVSPAFGDTSGPRLVAEGRVGGGAVFGYAEVAWMPSMDDIHPAGMAADLERVDGREYEVGVGLGFLPWLQVRLAYHEVKFDMSRVGGGDLTVGSDGWLLGAGFRF